MNEIIEKIVILCAYQDDGMMPNLCKAEIRLIVNSTMQALIDEAEKERDENCPMEIDNDPNFLLPCYAAIWLKQKLNK